VILHLLLTSLVLADNVAVAIGERETELVKVRNLPMHPAQLLQQKLLPTAALCPFLPIPPQPQEVAGAARTYRVQQQNHHSKYLAPAPYVYFHPCPAIDPSSKTLINFDLLIAYSTTTSLNLPAYLSRWFLRMCH
jgi:hypothetical protein